jgi:hypothetical protein
MTTGGGLCGVVESSYESSLDSRHVFALIAEGP